MLVCFTMISTMLEWQQMNTSWLSQASALAFREKVSLEKCIFDWTHNNNQLITESYEKISSLMFLYFTTQSGDFAHRAGHSIVRPWPTHRTVHHTTTSISHPIVSYPIKHLRTALNFVHRQFNSLKVNKSKIFQSSLV